MWIVKLALRRPYTFVVMALLILLLGVSAIKKNADGHLSRDRYPGGNGRIAISFCGGEVAGGSGQ
jgi:hypothetical protein